MTDFLQLRSLKTLEILTSEDSYVVKAEGVNQWVTYPLCKTGRLHGHGSQEQSFQDTPTHGKPVVIFIQRRRYRCTSCTKTLFEPVRTLMENAKPRRVWCVISATSPSPRPLRPLPGK